jgi:hypothetical protein
MSLGKLTFLSADCDGSGAVVGSSRMVADSSGTEGAGCPGVVDGPGGAGVTPPRGAAGALPAAGGLAAAGELAAAASAGALAPRVAVDADAGPTRLPALDAAGWRLACSAARRVTSAAPDKTTPLRAIRTIDRLFGITHHSKAYCCTGAIRAVTPGQSQLRCGGRLPIGATYDMAGTLFGAQWIGDWR